MGDGLGGTLADELTGDVGAPDAAVMRTIRELFVREEPLVESATFDSALAPRELRVEFADGIEAATRCRLDVTWYATGAYRFHYTDDADVDWGFDRHPNDHSPEKHFHAPPAAESESALRSCIEVEEARLVARAILKLRRRAYDTGSLARLNAAQNPP
jgi:hypothetical protein